jgi:hypothetical protein
MYLKCELFNLFAIFFLSSTGTIDIPTNSLALGQEMETWYTISPTSTGNNEGASLRIRAKYQRNLILPLGIYNELLEVKFNSDHPRFTRYFTRVILPYVVAVDVRY